MKEEIIGTFSSIFSGISAKERASPFFLARVRRGHWSRTKWISKTTRRLTWASQKSTSVSQSDSDPVFLARKFDGSSRKLGLRSKNWWEYPRHNGRKDRPKVGWSTSQASESIQESKGRNGWRWSRLWQWRWYGHWKVDLHTESFLDLQSFRRSEEISMFFGAWREIRKGFFLMTVFDPPRSPCIQ